LTVEHRGTPPPAEPAPPSVTSSTSGPGRSESRPTAPDPGDLSDPRSLQILSTEHWSLLATRSMTWNESFARTGLFLSVLSASVVALGLVGGATGFGSAFVVFALALLPVTLFVGLATFVRLDEVNMEDALWVAAMNRIRHAYIQAKPGLEPYFTTGWTDDLFGLGKTFAMTQEPTRANTFIHQFITTPGMVAVVNGALAAAIAGIALAAIVGPDMTSTIPIGLLVGVVLTAIQMWTTVRRGRRVLATWETRFPMPGATIRGAAGYWGGSKVTTSMERPAEVQQDR
jgi:hypothetical protein